MPTQTFEITAPNGNTLEVTGDHLPTESELHQIFAAAGVATDAKPSFGDQVARLPVMGAWMASPAAAAGARQGAGAAADLVANVAPTAGGIAGGVLGGIPGAAVGGAAGSIVKNAERAVLRRPNAPSSIGAAALDVGKDAALQAGGEVVGQGLGKASGAFGRMLMGQATNAPMQLSREFPDLNETMIQHSLTVSKGGLDKARDLLKAYKATANAALATADAAGASVPLTAATSALSNTFEHAVNAAAPDQALSTLARVERQLGQGRSSTLTLREADALKTSLQTDARALYKQIAAGMGSKGKAIEMIAKADMAASLNQAIEGAATKAGAPGYQAANSSAQDLIGATRAISRRLFQAGEPFGEVAAELATPSVLGAMLRGGPGAVAAAAGTGAAKAASTPPSLSRLALLAGHPATQQFVRQLPKPVLQALGEALWPATSGPSSEPDR